MQFTHKNSGVSEKDLNQSALTLKPYFTELQVAARAADYGYDESTLHLPADKALHGQVLTLAKQKKKIAEVMVVGIGGSNLGAMAICEAIHPSGPWLSFYDTVFVYNRGLQRGIERMQKHFKAGQGVIINIISKSGGTVETIANAKLVLEL